MTDAARRRMIDATRDAPNQNQEVVRLVAIQKIEFQGLHADIWLEIVVKVSVLPIWIQIGGMLTSFTFWRIVLLLYDARRGRGGGE